MTARWCHGAIYDRWSFTDRLFSSSSFDSIIRIYLITSPGETILPLCKGAVKVRNIFSPSFSHWHNGEFSVGSEVWWRMNCADSSSVSRFKFLIFLWKVKNQTNHWLLFFDFYLVRIHRGTTSTVLVRISDQTKSIHSLPSHCMRESVNTLERFLFFCELKFRINFCS